MWNIKRIKWRVIEEVSVKGYGLEVIGYRSMARDDRQNLRYQEVASFNETNKFIISMHHDLLTEKTA